MTNSKKLFQELLDKIKLSDREEAAAIVYYLLEAKVGLSRSEVLMNKKIEISLDAFKNDINRINEHEPIQYIAGYAWFRNRKFFVNPSVLIPRPETELLVQEVINLGKKNPTILDVGTGSGCIAISLALEISGSKVMALDISESALETARQNAMALDAEVDFTKKDFLKDDLEISNLDYLVSNPPYIREAEKKSMEPNVLNFEPHSALFVPDNDPIIFYHALAIKGKKIIRPGGRVIAEINPQLSNETKSCFEKEDYRDVTLVKDLEGKERIVIATR